VAERRWGPYRFPSTPGTGVESQYPGDLLGLAEDGPGSVSGVGRRFAALFIDWLLCELISVALLHSTYLTLVVFAVEAWLLTATTGSTVGQRLLRIRVIRLGGGPVGWLWAGLRTLLILAVVPPLVLDRDLRGLHDKATNTVVTRI
jgi:hypothetical protein